MINTDPDSRGFVPSLAVILVLIIFKGLIVFSCQSEFLETNCRILFTGSGTTLASLPPPPWTAPSKSTASPKDERNNTPLPLLCTYCMHIFHNADIFSIGLFPLRGVLTFFLKMVPTTPDFNCFSLTNILATLWIDSFFASLKNKFVGILTSKAGLE